MELSTEAAAYDGVAETYFRTNFKADKQHSIAQTIMTMAGEIAGKRILDAGCGSGIFTRTFAYLRAPDQVIGWDISESQISMAHELTRGPLGRMFFMAVRFQRRDIFTDELPPVDIINAPFVINYAKDVGQLQDLMRRFYNALSPGGKLIGVVDFPSGRDLRKYGARKVLRGPAEDGTPIEITVYDDAGEIMVLPPLARYYHKETLETALATAGFNFRWQRALISRQGVKAYGADFWRGYTDDPELGYFLASKD